MSPPDPHVRDSRLRGKDWLLAGGLLSLAGFCVCPNSYGVMVRWPWVMVWQGGLGAIALFLFLSLRHPKQVSQPLGFGLDWAIFLTLFSLLFTTLFAQQLHASLWYLLMASGYGMVLYALVNRCSDRPNQGQGPGQWAADQRWQLLRATGAVAFVSIGVGLGLWLPLQMQAGVQTINPFPLGHHHFMAGYLVLNLPLLAVLTLGSRGLERSLWGLGLALGILALYSTHSSLAGVAAIVLAGFGLTVAICGPVFSSLRQSGLKVTLRSFWPRLGLSLAGLSGLVAAGMILRAELFQKLEVASTGINPGGLETWPFSLLELGGLDAWVSDRFIPFLTLRRLLLEAALGIWQDHGLWGVGLGNLIKVYDLYRPIAAGAEAFRVQQVQSTPLQILAELGLLGGLAYGLWLGLLIVLGCRLAARFDILGKHRFGQREFTVEEAYLSQLWRRDRLVFWGCSSSLLAYGVSSLLDFQLENIGISLTLVVILTLILSLGQTYLGAVQIRVFPLERPLAWGMLGIMALTLSVWVPVDTAMFWARTGMKGLDDRDMLYFYEHWSKATELVPWDAYYDFQIGAQLTQFVEVLNDQGLPDQLSLPPDQVGQERQFRESLLRQARTHLEYAANGVPSDELFNRYLGSLLTDLDPEQAIPYLRRAAQLTPRKAYTYAMMGTAHAAINPNAPEFLGAMAIEGFINPPFLMSDLWFLPELQERWTTVLQLSIQFYDQCLAQFAETDVRADILYQNRTLLAWWLAQLQQVPFDWSTIAFARLRPIAQALAHLDQGQTQLALVDLDAAPESHAALFRAWIDPDRYLNSLFGSQRPQGLLAERLEELRKSIETERNLGAWLLSLQDNARLKSERIGFFSYRNTNGPDVVQLPFLLPINLIVRGLDLFPQVGYLPEFDQTLVAMQKQLLLLDRPLNRET